MNNNNENATNLNGNGTYEVGYKKPSKDAMWKKGESGNPNGKPVGTIHSRTIIKKWLEVTQGYENPITGKQVELSQLDIIALEQLKKAKEGDTTAFNALLDRSEGKNNPGLRVGVEVQINSIKIVDVDGSEI